jgi:hypothetical protein
MTFIDPLPLVRIGQVHHQARQVGTVNVGQILVPKVDACAPFVR